MCYINWKQLKILKKRHKIENAFATLKNKDRVHVRKDKKIKNYLSFVYITLLESLFHFADNNDTLLIEKINIFLNNSIL